MKNQWKVGELAKLTGMTIITLRYYYQIGLFSPSYYLESGQRLYSREDLLELQKNQSLKQIGLSLEQVQAVLTALCLLLRRMIRNCKEQRRSSTRSILEIIYRTAWTRKYIVIS